eukprot:CAMPEP_0197663952 /NCGR_PEP_ID=MMETSP1338-20131121/58342_1 /TAXON_ID=43686 ORGANISM="Pelagodinium beii, Strain RCC1491" /NCGR_SAMPLE_ID=MMETSP1338 /ASSEMBLY_ACC=CAM_ASM_000754 /LENGTH=523 /DNA_ID=CAMNT_0043242493 /DNA_START=35 /DNA_END=1606 /DNA_ORIENTATION=-
MRPCEGPGRRFPASARLASIYVACFMPSVAAESECESESVSVTMLQVGLQQESVEDLRGKHAVEQKADPVPANSASDWLFHVVTTECTEQVTFDIATDSLFARSFLPMLLLGCTCMVWFGGRGPSAEDAIESAPNGYSRNSPSLKERLYWLDFARVGAIVCVIFEHCGGQGYTRRNAMFGLWWTLNYLYMTSGVASMMSKQPLLGYMSRLAMIFAVGVCFNWIGDVIIQRDWRHDFGNTIFQMFFVVMLLIMAVLCQPLRTGLLQSKDESGKCVDVKTFGVYMGLVSSGTIALIGLVFAAFKVNMGVTLGSTNWADYYGSMIEHVPIFLAVFGGAFFLCYLSLATGFRQRHGMVGWAILALLHLATIFVPWHQGMQQARLLSWYVMAMYTHVWPLTGSTAIANALRSYWPLVLITLVLLSMPDMVGRCDMYEAGTVWERFRHSTGEAIMVLLFVTGAYKCSDPLQLATPLNYWSLWAYVSHYAFYKVWGSPAAAVVSFGTAPIFVAHHWLRAKEDLLKNPAKA